LLRARSPYVGTGMEYITARDSGAVVVTRRTGTVDYVDSQRIVVRVEGQGENPDDLSKEMGADIYPMTKFKRSNQNTCINQKPIVRVGQKVQKGQVMADGPCTELGEVALGRNVLVAFMPWRGYNFEDAILVSEKMVKEDYYTSIHIEEFEIEARDTKLGPEEITRDIPNVSETYLRDLDDSGIIRIGANVKPGDILVGKVTPKGETQLTPEEKLLRAIFGEKAGDVRDASLICPPGIEGIIVGVKIFSRKGIEKDDRAKAIEQEELDLMEKNLQDEIRILHDEVKKRVIMMLKGQELRSDLFDEYGRERLHKKGTVLSDEILQAMPYETMVRLKIATDDSRLEDDLRDLEERTERNVEVIRNLFEEKKEKIRRGDELPPGVIKLVKVYVAMKRKLSAGEKMAGRHGRLHLHAEALAPGRRQDPRAIDRAVLAHHPAAAGRQGAVRRPALRRDGGLGARSIRLGAHPPGAAHGEVGRCDRAREDLRGDREGRCVVHGGAARVVQRAHSRAAVAVPRRRADQDEEETRGSYPSAGARGSLRLLS